MKNLQDNSFKPSFVVNFYSITRYALRLFRAIVIVATTLNLVAISSIVQADDNIEKKRVIAFSGGGYHALSGAASWMMGMMKRKQDFNLSSITSEIDAIGSNSGGSWFMTLSGYSESFQSEIESPRAADSFTKDNGYMGRVWKDLQSMAPCPPPDSIIGEACEGIMAIFEAAGEEGFAKFLFAGDGQWQTTIEKSVFGKGQWEYYDELSSGTLSKGKRPWLEDMDWVLAGTFLTDSPSLTYTLFPEMLIGRNIQANQGSQKQTFPELSAVTGGTPVMMATSGGVDISLFPAGNMSLDYGIWNTGFESLGNIQTISNIEMKSSVYNLPVMKAAGISSAAGGIFVDIPMMKQNKEKFGNAPANSIATILNGFAPAYQFEEDNKPAMEFLINVHDKFSGDSDADKLNRELSDNKVARLADGGFTDNTAVVQMLRYLQEANGGTIPDGFNIVAFDDFPVDRAVWSETDTPFPTGNDIAALFGFDKCDNAGCSMQYPGSFTRSSSLLGLKFATMSAQVFDCDQYFQDGKGLQCGGPPIMEKLMWSLEEDKIMCKSHALSKEIEQPLLYARYDDLTVNESLPGSKLFGLKNGDENPKGTLHVFSIIGSGAAVVPGDQDQFDCYSRMVRKIVEQVVATNELCDTTKKDAGNCTLGDYLEDALGLNN